MSLAVSTSESTSLSTGLDGTVERAARWLAARWTRRSFLARSGQVGLAVAGGSVLSTLLIEQAEARVCGQSGYSLKCPTYDCPSPAVWGWCWYASGCCADGSMKKICDCCLLNFPNVHGYCPTATNVYCIVESCGTDPRLQTTSFVSLNGTSIDFITREIRAAKYRFGAAAVVLTDMSDDVSMAVSIPVAELSSAPIVVATPSSSAADLISQAQQLGAGEVRIVGRNLPASFDTAFAAAGFVVRRLGASADSGVFSRQVADWFFTQSPATPHVVTFAEPQNPSEFRLVGQSLIRTADSSRGDSAEITTSNGYANINERLALTAAFAARRLAPLVIGIDATVSLGRTTIAIGSTAAALQFIADGSFAVSPIPTHDLRALSAELAALGTRPGLGEIDEVAICTTDFGPAILGLATSAKPIILYNRGDINSGSAFFQNRRSFSGTPYRMNRVFFSMWGTPLPAAQYWLLQSYLNGFDAHLLRGVSGQGLPVISQPLAERPIGFAYIGPASSDRVVAPQPYWSGGRRR